MPIIFSVMTTLAGIRLFVFHREAKNTCQKHAVDQTTSFVDGLLKKVISPSFALHPPYGTSSKKQRSPSLRSAVLSSLFFFLLHIHQNRPHHAAISVNILVKPVSLAGQQGDPVQLLGFEHAGHITF
mgnify:CR=1 FL=1